MTCQRKVTLFAGLIILATAVTLIFCRPTSAQFGRGGGFGGDQRPPYLVAEGLIIVIAPDDQSVAAFSTHTGVWRKTTVKLADGEKITPVVGSQIAYFQAGDALFAFSAPKGSWHSVDIQAGAKVEAIVGSGYAIVQVGNKLYAFSAMAGRWDSVDNAPQK